MNSNIYYSGLGMAQPTRTHHVFISNLVFNFKTELRQTGLSKNYLVVSEDSVSTYRNDLAPDVTVWDIEADDLVIAIEITTHRMLKQIFRKCIGLANRFPETEFWIFDYERETLYFVDNNYEICAYNGERSSLFDLPFIEYFYDIY